MQQRLTPLAKRFWPDIESLNPILRAVVVGEVFGVVYSLPLLVIGLIGLVTATDPVVIYDEGPILLLLLVPIFLFNRLRFELALELKPSLPANSISALDNLILWSAALIFGPTALWLGVIHYSFDLAYRWRRETGRTTRWNLIRTASIQLTQVVLSGLFALLVYRAAGGTYPPDGFGDLGPAAAATVAQFVLATLIDLPLFIYFTDQLTKTMGGASRSVFIRFLAVTVLLPRLIDPFAVLAAGLYAQHGLGVYSFLVAGALLASLLANRLSTAVRFSEDRSRELASLERLSRDILNAPPDASTLPDLLRAHVPGMFAFAGIEIRFFPDTLIVHHPEMWEPIGPGLWKWARSITATQLFAPKSPLPWGEKPDRAARLYVPIQDMDSGALIGGIYLVRDRETRRVTALLPALQSLAGQIASAFHRARIYEQTLAHEKMEQELVFAGQLQASFLPSKLPSAPGWKIAAALKSARQTSGDFYDLIALPGGLIGLVVADVADKGTGAALYMALCRTLIRTYALEHPAQPAQALAAANRRILEDIQTDLFVTVFYGVLDPGSGRLTYCNAGHNPGYLLTGHNGGTVHELGKTGIPLGMFDTATWAEQCADIAPGDTLLLYTDGATEAQNREGDFYGTSRLVETARAHRELPAPALRDALWGDIFTFTGDIPQADDITLAVITRLHTST